MTKPSSQTMSLYLFLRLLRSKRRRISNISTVIPRIGQLVTEIFKALCVSTPSEWDFGGHVLQNCLGLDGRHIVRIAIAIAKLEKRIGSDPAVGIQILAWGPQRQLWVYNTAAAPPSIDRHVLVNCKSSCTRQGSRKPPRVHRQSDHSVKRQYRAAHHIIDHIENFF